MTLAPEQRRWPRPVAIVGLVGCVALALALPLAIVVSGTVVLIVGVIARQMAIRLG